jgi:hypothetical protein
MPTQQQLLDRIAPTLEPGEQVFALVLGYVGDDKFSSIVALTSKRLLFAGSTRGSIHIGNIKSITWSGLWSALNIDLRQPPMKRIVVSGSGPEWKRRARSLLEEAKSLIADSQK